MKKKYTLKRKLSALIAILLSMTMMFVIIPESAFAASGTGLNVNTPTQDEIRARIKAAEAMTCNVTYTQEPVTVGPNYSPGAINRESQESALALLNALRFTAGIPDNVKLKDEYIEQCQAGALVNAVNGEMSHNPNKPADMEQTLYNQGYKGCSSSNLDTGYGTLKDDLKSWMSDENNVTGNNLGHRRWCLNPSMQYTGFGLVGKYRAMYVFDNWSASTSYTGVAWPAQQMPSEYFNIHQLWSVSFGRVINQSAVTVDVTRNRGGAWHFGSDYTDGTFLVENTNYGQAGCVIFRPSSIDEYKPGDIFHVTIKENGREIADYDVEFFDIYNVTSVKINKDAVELETGKSEKLTANVLPFNATHKSVTWSSSNINVAKVDAFGEVTAKEEGTATITATDSSGKFFATCTVTVRTAKVQKPLPKTITLSYNDTTYTGTPKTPSVTIAGLKEGTNFTIRYENNVNAGTAKAVITGIGDYQGTVTKEFTIKATKLAESMFTISINSATGKATVSSAKLSVTKDYTVKENLSKDGKTLTVVVIGMGNYTGSIEKTFNIEIPEEKPTLPMDISKLSTDKVKLPYDGYVYTGKPQTPKVTIEGMTERIDFTTTYENNVNKGTAKVIIKGIGKYTGTLIKTFPITAKAINSYEMTCTFDQTTQKAKVSIGTLKEGIDFTVKLTFNTDKTMVTVRADGIGNYNYYIQKTISVGVKKLNSADFDIEYTKTIYDGKSKMPKITAKEMTEGKDYTVTYENNVNAGIAKAVITGKGNYFGNVTKNFQITPKNLPTDIMLKAYKEGKLHGKVGDLVESKDYTVKIADKSVRIDGIGNYCGGIRIDQKDDGNTDIIENAGNSESGDSQSGATDTTPDITYGIESTTINMKTTSRKDGITLSWNKSEGYKLDGYEIFRGTSEENLKKYSTTNKTSWKNTGNLKKGTTYYYQVRGYRMVDGEKVYTQWSEIVCEKVVKTSTDYGVKHTTVKAKTASAKGYIKVSYTKSKGYKVDGYQVYRGASKKSMSKICTTKKLLVKNRKNVKRGKTYYYKVRGYRRVNGKLCYTEWSNIIAVKAK